MAVGDYGGRWGAPTTVTSRPPRSTLSKGGSKGASSSMASFSPFIIELTRRKAGLYLSLMATLVCSSYATTTTPGAPQDMDSSTRNTYRRPSYSLSPSHQHNLASLVQFTFQPHTEEVEGEGEGDEEEEWLCLTDLVKLVDTTISRTVEPEMIESMWDRDMGIGIKQARDIIAR